jgi:hypothetical protein
LKSILNNEGEVCNEIRKRQNSGNVFQITCLRVKSTPLLWGWDLNWKQVCENKLLWKISGLKKYE